MEFHIFRLFNLTFFSLILGLLSTLASARPLAPFSHESSSLIRRHPANESCQVWPESLETKLFSFSAQSNQPRDFSDYWAQEYTGSDLVRARLQELAADNRLYPKDKIVHITDVFGGDAHGLQVQNLIASSSNSGATVPIDGLTLAFDINQRGERSWIDSIRTESIPLPRLVNRSMGPPPLDSDLSHLITLLQERKPLYIASAGNAFDEYRLSPGKSRMATQGAAILVASSAPSGELSRFSNEGKEVVVTAPSDYYITAAEFMFKKFGGTSGAAPQVTGALLAIELLLPEMLTPTLAIELLEKTRIPTLLTHPGNGGGHLNAYRLFTIVETVATLCPASLDRDVRNSCARKLLSQPLTKLVPPAQPEVLERASAIFPSCFGTPSETEMMTPDVCAQADTLKSLRREALLHPENSELFNTLACIHAHSGKSAMATHYSLLALGQRFPFSRLDASLRTSLISHLTSLATTPESRYFRTDFFSTLIERGGEEMAQSLAGALFRSESALPPLPFAEVLLADAPVERAESIISSYLSIKTKPHSDWDLFFAQHSQPSVRRAYAMKIIENPRLDPERDSHFWAQDPDPAIRVAAVESWLLGGSRPPTLLAELAEDPQQEVRLALVSFLGRAQLVTGEPQRHSELLVTLSRDLDPTIRNRALSLLTQKNLDQPELVLTQWLADPDPLVQDGALVFCLARDLTPWGKNCATALLKKKLPPPATPRSKETVPLQTSLGVLSLLRLSQNPEVFLPALNQLWRSKNLLLQIGAVDLAFYHFDRAPNALLKLLKSWSKHGSTEVRIRIASLSSRNVHIPVLQSLILDPSGATVQAIVFSQCAKLKEPGFKLLSQVVRGRAATTTILAIPFLRALVPSVPQARDLLTRLSQHRNPSIAEEALIQLRKTGG